MRDDGLLDETALRSALRLDEGIGRADDAAVAGPVLQALPQHRTLGENLLWSQNPTKLAGERGGRVPGLRGSFLQEPSVPVADTASRRSACNVSQGAGNMLPAALENAGESEEKGDHLWV